MYNSFFGLRENAFNLSPDPAFLYRSPQHEEALANLIYGVQSRKGFIALTGEVGTGKTTMLECLRDFLGGQRIPFAYIFNSRITPDQFFEMLAYDFGLPGTRFTKTEVLFALNNMLLDRGRAGTTAVLIIDEAHNLDWDVLEEIRLLGNLENRRGKLLQIVLSGQPELDLKLDAPQFRQLKQRIALRFALHAFTAAETEEYINFRLAHAGLANQKVFDENVAGMINQRATGIPRLVNLICDNSMLIAFALNSRHVTPEMVDEVCADLKIDAGPAFTDLRRQPVFPSRPRKA
jgi:type II secretory pathway predicted ATPase ExeA